MCRSSRRTARMRLGAAAEAAIGAARVLSRTHAGLVVGGGLVAETALAGTVWLPGLGGVVNVPTQSIQELKFAEVIRQQFDFSCGSAALATLLTYHYEDPTDEMQAFIAMYEQGDQERIRQAGFSLLDMKNYLAAVGYDIRRVSGGPRYARERRRAGDRADQFQRISALRRDQGHSRGRRAAPGPGARPAHASARAVRVHVGERAPGEEAALPASRRRSAAGRLPLELGQRLLRDAERVDGGGNA